MLLNYHREEPLGIWGFPHCVIVSWVEGRSAVPWWPVTSAWK